LSVGAIVNVASFRNPHVRTIFEKGLWGFKERDRGRWNLLERGTRVLLYGDKGIRMAGYVESKYESHEPVIEWIKDPAGYPLRITLSLVNEDVDDVNPIERDELVSDYNIGQANIGFRGINLVIFGLGGEYPLSEFDKIWDEFLRRNGIVGGPPRPREGRGEVGGLEGYVEDALEKMRKYRGRPWTEDDTKAILVEPLLRALGWDTSSLDDVARGYQITVGTRRAEVDYALKVDGRPRVFLEVKALGKDLGESDVEQTLSYARLGDVEWAVLTNGGGLRVYDAARRSQVIRLRLDEYLKERDKLLLLSRGKVKEGALRKFADERYHRQAVLKWFRESADALVEEIVKSKPELKREIVGKVVREILEKMEAV
jgi:hypothetical protein